MRYFFSVGYAATNDNTDWQSVKFALDLNTGSGNLTEVNKIAALIGHYPCAAWQNSACNDG